MAKCPLLPKISPDTEFFWQGCKEHKLRLQKCSDCGHVRWPAGHFCPQCGSRAFALAALAGTGQVNSFLVFQRAFHPAFASLVPYVVATIDLDGGARIVSNVVNCDPRRVECGMPVKLRWQDYDEISVPVFEPMH